MSPKADGNPPFPVVQLTDENGCGFLFRMIRLESDDERYVLYDLSQKQSQRRQQLILPEQPTTAQAMRETMVVVPDTVSHRRMAAQRVWEAECRHASREKRSLAADLRPPDLVGENLKGWEAAKHALRGIIGNRDERNAQLCRRGVDALFLDRRFRDKVLREEAENVGVDKAELKRIFFRWIRFGGDAAALIPRRGEDEPPGTPRTPSEAAMRVGRMNAKELEGAESRKTKGMTAHWRACIQVLVISLIFQEAPRKDGTIDIEKVFVLLTKGSRFWKQFQARFYVGPASEGEIENRPTKAMVIYHRNRVVNENEATIRRALRKINSLRHPRRLQPIPGGAAVDRNADILETIEMDATEFRKIQIVALSSKGERIRLGHATLIVACSRSTGAVVGWHVMIGRETADAYRKCLYWTLCDKAPLLRALGLDPDKLPGIVSGACDEVLVDRGPGSGELMRLYTTGSAIMDLSVTRPYTAVDKGTVEGANKLIKEDVRERTNQSKKISPSVKLDEEISRRYRSLPAGYHTMRRLDARKRRAVSKRPSSGVRAPKEDEPAPKTSGRIVELEMQTFMRLVVDSVNKLNLEPRTDELARTRDMIVERVPPTRAAMHRARQAQRLADGARPANVLSLASEVLAFEHVEVRHGVIRRNNVWYGVGSEGPGEVHPGVRLLLQDAKAWADNNSESPFKIEVAFPPDPTRLVALWRRRFEQSDRDTELELFELPATLRSLRTYGSDVGVEVAKGLRRCILKEQAYMQKCDAVFINYADPTAVGDNDEDDMVEVRSDFTRRSDCGPTQPCVNVPKNSTSTGETDDNSAYVPPAMGSRGIGGKNFDFHAWLKSISK